MIWLWLFMSFIAGFLLGNLFGMRSALRWTTLLKHIVLGAVWPGYPITYPMREKPGEERPTSPVGKPMCVLCRQRKTKWGGRWEEMGAGWYWTCEECLKAKERGDD